MLELLVVIAIVSILASLLFPFVGSLREKATAAKCAGRLRMIGGMVHSYAAENNATIRFFTGGTYTRQMWYTELKAYAEMSEIEAKHAFGCPSMPWEDVGEWNSYGFRVRGMPGHEELWLSDDGKTTGIYRLIFPSVAEPSKFFIMADTFLPAANREDFRIVPPNLYGGGGIHLRHRHRANVLFLDGHVAALDSAGLNTIGIDEALDAKGNSIQTPQPTP